MFAARPRGSVDGLKAPHHQMPGVAGIDQLAAGMVGVPSWEYGAVGRIPYRSPVTQPAIPKVP